MATIGNIIREVLGWNLTAWWAIGMADLAFYLGRGFLQSVGI